MIAFSARRPCRPGAARWLLASFWVADVLVLAMLAFFVIVGGASSPVAVVICIVLALLYAAHAIWLRRHGGDGLSRDAQRMRERRGF